MNRKYVSIKRDLALQKQEIKQLKDKVSEAAAKASGSSGASSQTTAGAAAAKRGEELQHTIDRLQRQLSERVQSTALSTANGSSSSSSRRSNRLLDDQALTQLASRCYEVLVALLLRCQDLPQQDAAAAKPRDPEGSLAAVEGSAEVVYAEIEQAFVALQVMLSSPSGADESSLLNLCSVAASVVFLAHSCHQHAPCWLANTMEPADGASPDHSLAPALCSSQQQDGSYTALNSTRTPSLLSMAADRPGSAGTVLRRARDRGDKKEWAAAEPLPLLLRFLTRLLSTIIAAINSHIMPRAERSAAEGAVDLADRFDDASPDGPGNSAVKKRKTEGRCHGAPLASLVLPAAAAGALDDAYTAARDNANTILGSDRPAPMLDVYQDLLALVVSLAKQLLAHRSASPNLKGVPQLPPPLQQEVDEAAVELLLLLPSSAAEGLISSDFIASKLLRKGADQSAPFLLSLFSDVDAVASNAPGLAAVAALSSLRVQTRLLQYLEQLLTDPGIFNCFCICQMRGERGSGNRGKKSSPADTERAAPPGTEPTSFCALLSQLAERYSQAAHWPSALSCDTDCDPGGRAVSEAKRVFALNAMRLLLRLVRRHGAAGVLALLGECGGAGAAADLSLALQQTPRDPSAVNAIIGRRCPSCMTIRRRLIVPLPSVYPSVYSSIRLSVYLPFCASGSRQLHAAAGRRLGLSGGGRRGAAGLRGAAAERCLPGSVSAGTYLFRSPVTYLAVYFPPLPTPPLPFFLSSFLPFFYASFYTIGLQQHHDQREQPARERTAVPLVLRLLPRAPGAAGGAAHSVLRRQRLGALAGLALGGAFCKL